MKRKNVKYMRWLAVIVITIAVALVLTAIWIPASMPLELKLLQTALVLIFIGFICTMPISLMNIED